MLRLVQYKVVRDYHLKREFYLYKNPRDDNLYNITYERKSRFSRRYQRHATVLKYAAYTKHILILYDYSVPLVNHAAEKPQYFLAFFLSFSFNVLRYVVQFEQHWRERCLAR